MSNQDEFINQYREIGLSKLIKDQASNYSKVVKSKAPFTDEVFKPVDTSLYSGESSFSQQHKPDLIKKITKNQNVPTQPIRDQKYSWMRLSELYNIKDLNIVKEPKEIKEYPDILCEDIKQGELGDCYLLSALCSMAENPNRIKNLFANNSVNQSGIFEIKIFLHGEPMFVVVDDYVVVKGANQSEEENNDNVKPQLAFTGINSKTNNIWPILLEKAWAKLNLNYENIIAGNCSDAFEFFSPAPYTTLYHNVHQDIIFDVIKEAKKRDYIVCCDITAPTNSKELNKLKSQGLISNHAYSIIEIAEISDLTGAKTQLLRIRNPWGSNEWEGDWSDKSSKWTEENKKLLTYDDKDDGIFWISLPDFLRYYTSTHICHERDGFFFESAKLTFDGDKPFNFFKVIVPKDTSGAFIINQKNTRLYRNALQSNTYENHYGSMIVFRYDGDKIKAIGCDSGRKNRMFVECDSIEKGEYIIAVNFPIHKATVVAEDAPLMNENLNTDDDYTVNVGVYTGVDKCIIEDIPESDSDVKNFLIEYTVDDATKKDNKYFFTDEGENDSFRVPFFDQKSAYGYVYYENKSDGYINEILTFTELFNVNIIPLLRKGELGSLRTLVDSSEDPNEKLQLSQLEKKIDVQSKIEILKNVNEGEKVTKKRPVEIKVKIAPKSSGVLLLEKNNEEARVNMESSIVITYPLHHILSDQRFPSSKTRVKYNNKLVDIYETIIEHNSGVLVRYRNKTKNLVFGSFIKFGELKNLRISLNSDELKKEALKAEKEEEAHLHEEKEGKEGKRDTHNLESGRQAEEVDVNDFNLEVKNPSKEVALVLEPGEVKFVQLEAINEFETYSYSLDSTYYINISRYSQK